jgi:hypothetical protein
MDIIHQKPYVLTGRVITLGMVKKLVCERNGKQMNSTTYA